VTRALKMTNQQAQEIVKRAARGWVPEEVKPVPELPGPLDVDDRYANNWERQYGEVHLEQRRHLKEIRDWEYEAVKFRIAKKTYFTPDFMVIGLQWIEFHDVKGFLRDDAAVKIKACRELFPWFKWAYAKKEKGIWEVYYI